MPRVFLSIQLVHGLKAKMKNKLMPMWDKIMLRKRYIIECINELLKNKANLVHSRHRSIHNFIMNLCSALTAYCFFDNTSGTFTLISTPHLIPGVEEVILSSAITVILFS